MNRYIFEQSVLYLQRHSRPQPRSESEADASPRRGLRVLAVNLGHFLGVFTARPRPRQRLLDQRDARHQA